MCFCDSLYKTSEWSRLSLSVVCYAGASTASSLCVWYQRMASGYTQVIHKENETTGLHIAYCYLKEKKTAAIRYSPSFSFYFLLSLCCHIPPCNDFPFSWAQCWKCAITVRQTRAQSKPVWLIILVPVQECCFRYLLRPIFILLALGLRHDSVVKGKVGENHGRQWGVSLTVRKTAREDWAGWVHLHPVVWLLFSSFNVIQKESGTFCAREETRAGRVRETNVSLLELFFLSLREIIRWHIWVTLGGQQHGKMHCLWEIESELF